MIRTPLSRAKKLLLCSVALLTAFLCAPSRLSAQEADPHQPSAELIALGFKFMGAQTCAAAKCHAAPSPPAGSKIQGNENTIWSKNDPHARSFTSLTRPKDPKYADIGKKLGIAKVAESNRCLNCHALNVPANLQGKDFNLREGNTCENCHGPAEKWAEPHSKVGWTDEQRQGKSAADLLKSIGLNDTKSPMARAENCTRCHLSIDPELVAAGHPQPIFELSYFSDLSAFATEKFETKNHWPPTKGFEDASLWAAGQAVALREAMTQVVNRAGNAKSTPEQLSAAIRQALGHYLVFRQLVASGAIAGDAAGWDAQAQKLVDGAKDPSNKDAIKAAAAAIADGAAKASSSVAGFKPDAASVKKLLQGILGESTVAAKADLRGVEQQAFAAYALFNALNKGTNATPPQATSDAINALFPDPTSDKVDPEYGKKLQAAAAVIK